MTFTEERPAFGWLAGRIWCPQHARGTAKAGTVIKEYQVVPQAAEGTPETQSDDDPPRIRAAGQTGEQNV